MNLFYTIWADALHLIGQNRSVLRDCFFVFIFFMMSFLLWLNIVTLCMIILFFTGFDILAYLIFCPNKYKVLFLFISLLIPCIINYFFVFHKKKYKYILEFYKNRFGLLLLAYFVFSLFLNTGIRLLNN